MRNFDNEFYILTSNDGWYVSFTDNFTGPKKTAKSIPNPTLTYNSLQSVPTEQVSSGGI